MDLRALMQTLETINTTQPLTESVGKRVVITESVATPNRRIEEPTFKSSIARSLVEDFGYDLAKAPAAGGVPNPYQGPDAAKFAAMSPEDQAWLTKGGGKPDINDEFILRRAPGGGKAVAAPAPAPAPAGGPAVPPGGVQAQGDDDGNTMITKPDGTVQVVGPDGKPLPNGGRVDPAAPANKPKPAADPAVAATREKFKALMDKLEKTGGVTGAAAAPAAAKPTGGAGTKPAAKPAVAQGSTTPPVNAMGDVTGVQETLQYADDQTLLAIKNIRY